MFFWNLKKKHKIRILEHWLPVKIWNPLQPSSTSLKVLWLSLFVCYSRDNRTCLNGWHMWVFVRFDGIVRYMISDDNDDDSAGGEDGRAHRRRPNATASGRVAQLRQDGRHHGAHSSSWSSRLSADGQRPPQTDPATAHWSVVGILGSLKRT